MAEWESEWREAGGSKQGSTNKPTKKNHKINGTKLYIRAIEGLLV